MTDPALLLSIRNSISTCTRCPLHEHTFPVPWSGDPLCEIAVLGEAPGRTEARDGEPFVGSAGIQLRGIFKRVGIDPSKVAFVNSVSCWPDRTPTTAEIDICRPNARLQLAALQPRYLITVGVVALQSVRGKCPESSWLDLATIHGNPMKWHNPPYPCDPIAVWPTYHPSSALPNRPTGKKYLALIENDIRKFVEWKAADERGSDWPSVCVVCKGELYRYDDWGLPMCYRHAARQQMLFSEDVGMKT